MGRNVLITGGAGFIGSNLTLSLLKRGYEVTVLDNLSPQVHGQSGSSHTYMSIKDKVRFLRDDVRSAPAWEKALLNQHIVVHLAAETGTGQSMYEIARYTDVNVQGTANMLNHLAGSSHNVEKVVVASSRAVYGEGKYLCEKDGVVYPGHRRKSDLESGLFECRCPVCDATVSLRTTDEESLLHPSSVYGITKHTQEQMVVTVCGALNIPAIALRYQNVYGPGQSLSNPYTGILSIFSTLIKNGKDINIFEDGKESRDFVYIDDIVAATVLAMEKPAPQIGVLNIGSGRSVTVKTIADTLVEKYGGKVQCAISGNFRMGDIRHNCADITRARRWLGFEPAYAFEAGISRFVEWVNTQSVEGNGYDKSIAEMKLRGLFN